MQVVQGLADGAGGQAQTASTSAIAHSSQIASSVSSSLLADETSLSNRER